MMNATILHKTQPTKKSINFSRTDLLSQQLSTDDVYLFDCQLLCVLLADRNLAKSAVTRDLDFLVSSERLSL